MALCAAAAVAVGVALPFHAFSSASASNQLVRNGGFEKGLRGWTGIDDAHRLIRVHDAHSGDFAVRAPVRKSGAVAVKDRPNTVRYTPADATYRATAWVKSDQQGAVVSLRLREVRQDRIPGTRVRVLVHTQSAGTVLQDRDWHRLTLVYRAQPGHQLDLGVFLWNGTAGRSLTVDDVSLVRIDDDQASRGGPAASSPPAPEKKPNAQPTTPGKDASPPSQPPDATEPATDPAPIVAGDTLFGFSALQENGESWPQAVARRDRTIGTADVIRVFYPGLPQAWPGRAGSVDRDVVVSFKANPSEVTAGSDDQRLRTWFATAPRDRVVFWSYFHEPEDDIERGSFTAAQYRAAWTHIAKLADEAGNPNLRATLILMAWSVNKASGRTWTDYYPGGNVIDVIGWDAYNTAAKGKQPSYASPAAIYDPPAAAARAVGKPFGFAEWGSTLLPGDSGADRAAWVRASTSYQAKIGAVFSTYFDSTVGGDFRLTDEASRQALGAAIGD